MRKVKVAAAFLCLMSAGMLGGIAIEGNDVSVAHMDQRDQILEVTEETVTTAASIETTAIVTTATTAKSTTALKAVTTTAITTTTMSAATTTAQTTLQTEPEQEAAPETVTEAVFTEDVSFLAPATATEPPVLSEAPAPAQTETVTDPVQSETATEASNTSYAITVTDREYIMLCNVVGHEYGADWVPVEEKALVAEVIMNRVNSPTFPNSIYEVLTQRNQFAGLEYLIEMNEMSHYVTPSVMEAVNLYLSHPEQFQHGYLFFNGDGSRNYFRTSF